MAPPAPPADDVDQSGPGVPLSVDDAMTVLSTTVDILSLLSLRNDQTPSPDNEEADL
jgi:hypothetical protein